MVGQNRNCCCRTFVCTVILLLSTCASAQPATPAPSPQREQFVNATVIYDWVTNQRGQKLRTFVTQPKHGSGKVPVIFFVGWLSCDTMEYPNPNTRDGFGIFMRRLIEQSGYATVRMNKPGVGESQGDCSKADFQSEMEGWQAAFDLLGKYDFIDQNRMFVIGLSNGGGFSPLVARDHPVRGFISAGSWGRSWYEHMLELERRRLIEEGKSPTEVNTSVKAFADLYNLYLMKGMAPRQVMAQHPEWKTLWYDEPDGQYGRPAAFYQQLQALNLGDAWSKVDAPVLVIRGTSDNIMSRLDSEAIVQIVNQVHPGRARYLEIDDMTHGFTVKGKFYDDLVPTVLNWMKEQLTN
jgi:pimeloyl-ACP methyl ester carboxylesterase